MSKICCITNKKSFIGNKKSHSNKKSKRKFISNIKKKKFWINNSNKFIKLNVSTKAIRIINKNGIEKTLNKFKIKI